MRKEIKPIRLTESGTAGMARSWLFIIACIAFVIVDQ